MNRELLRLATFSSWPATAKASPVRLAKAGLYFNGQGDTTICFSCSSLFDTWTQGDDPFERHRRRNSNCPITLGIDKENVPLQLYPVSTSSTSLTSHDGNTDEDSTDSNAPEVQNILNESELLLIYNSAYIRAKRRDVFQESPDISIDRTKPDFDQLRRESVRLSTFHDWPTWTHAQPVELARDGFFFTGLDDRVQCAFCRRFLQSFLADSNPIDEHRKHSPDCSFLRNVTTGNPSTSDSTGLHFDQRNAVREQHLSRYNLSLNKKSL